MDAGKLNRRITIQRREVKRTASGQRVGDWVDYCTVWAQIQCTDSKTVDSDGVVVHEGIYKFFIRWRTGITAEMRVLYGDRVFELTGPPADWKDERSGLTLLAREII